jgi:hypothetical protein
VERPAARSFRDLIVWQRAHKSVLAVYRFTESFPEREKYQTESLMSTLEDASRLLNAYARAILASSVPYTRTPTDHNM